MASERQVESGGVGASTLDLTAYSYIFFPLARDNVKMKSPENLKDTLNLPKTDFPMRANAVEREPARMKHWEEKEVYSRMQQKRNKVNHLFCTMARLLQMGMFMWVLP